MFFNTKRIYDKITKKGHFLLMMVIFLITIQYKTIKIWCPCVHGICVHGICVLECMCMYVCVQKNDLTLFPDLHFVVFFVALSPCAEFIFYGFFLIPPPPHTFVTHDETMKQSATNQSMNKLSNVYQIKTNEAMCCKLDRSYNM